MTNDNWNLKYVFTLISNLENKNRAEFKSASKGSPLLSNFARSKIVKVEGVCPWLFYLRHSKRGVGFPLCEFFGIFVKVRKQNIFLCRFQH